MAQKTDLNVAPYYDDFKEDKNFHRILFRPGFAVQARELTQLQSILQNQIERFGSHVFQEGSIVIPGGISVNTSYSSVLLASTFASEAIDINQYYSATSPITIVGATTGVKAKVIGVKAATTTSQPLLYIQYISTGSDLETNIFADDENIFADTAITHTTSYAINSNSATTHNLNAAQKGTAITAGNGVYFVRGTFVQMEEQTLVLDDASQIASGRIGFTITETLAAPEDDASLTDNATGSSNFAAKGAHRLKIDLVLTSLPIDSTSDDKFVEITRVSEGKVDSDARPTEYSVLGDTLARRTFDESGDYTVRPFQIDAREQISNRHKGTEFRGVYTAGVLTADGNTAAEDFFDLAISPGKAYVRGYEIEKTAITFKDIKKARDFDTVNTGTVNTELGNFIKIKKLYNQPKVSAISGEQGAYETIQLHDDVTHTKGVASGRQIGLARARTIEYDSGSAGNDDAIYKLFLFDIRPFTYLTLSGVPSATLISNHANGGVRITGATTGATGFIFGNLTSAVTIVLTNVSGNFLTGEKLIASDSAETDQIVETAANADVTVLDVVTHTLSETRSLFQDDTDAGQDFTADIDLSGTIVGSLIANQSDANGTNENANFVSETDNTSTLALETKQDAKLIDSEKNVAIYRLSKKTIKTLLTTANDGASDTSITIRRQFIGTTNSSGGISFTAGANESFLTHTEKDYTLSVLTAGDGTAAQGDIVSVSGNITGAGTSTITITDNSALGDSSKVLLTATILKTGVTQRIKNTKLSKQVKVAGVTAGAFGTKATDEVISLGRADVFNLGVVLDSESTSADATLPTLTLTSATGTFTRGERITGSSSGAVGIVVSPTSPISYYLQNGDGAIDFSANEIITGASSTAIATVSSIAAGSRVITSHYVLDTGQRDNYYDISRLELKSNSAKPRGRLLVVFDFFSHSSGSFFSVDSYQDAAKRMQYDDIPTYTATRVDPDEPEPTGEFELTDCLDFRPTCENVTGASDTESAIDTLTDKSFDFFHRQFDGAGSSTVDTPKPGTLGTVDFEFYLNKIIAVYLGQDGTFKIVEGPSAEVPTEPKQIDGAMKLASAFIPAFTFRPTDIQISRERNQRFTMKDIGKLQNRIQNLEYYTNLSLLERDAESFEITDANGLNRFKSGFVVDNFSGHRVGDVKNTDYKNAIDQQFKELRPKCVMRAAGLIETVSTDTERAALGYAKTGDLLTLPYTSTMHSENPYATRVERIQPVYVPNWVGMIKLSPEGDEWFETETAPDLIINVDGNFDSVLAANENRIGTLWNAWETQWSGVIASRQETTRQGNRIITRAIQTTRSDLTRSGIATNVIEQIDEESSGTRIIAKALIPWVRPRTITFTGEGFYPNTKVYVFFDGTDVNAYVTAESSTYTEGAVTPAAGIQLVTDGLGDVNGTFAIPDYKFKGQENIPKFKTGELEFKITASATNLVSPLPITSGSVIYSAKGILETEQETIIATRNAKVVQTDVTQTTSVLDTSARIISQTAQRDNSDGKERREALRAAAIERGEKIDPLAQTFLVEDPDGCFLTSVDLYFETRDNDGPIWIELRNVINGYPGPKILPFGRKVLKPSEINVSTDASTATTFTFDSPIYVKGGTEYCIVVRAHTIQPKIWISRMGETDIGGLRVVSKQPHLGVLFKSQNNTAWTASQSEDLKFTLNKAVFDTTAAGNLTLQNDIIGDAVTNELGTTVYGKRLTANPLTMTNSSTVLKVKHIDHGMYSTANNVRITGVSSGISTTLSAGITAAGTSLVLTSNTNFPAGAITLKIGNEIITGSNSSGTVSSLTRGTSGSTAAIHDANATIELYQILGTSLVEINKIHTAIANIGIDSYTVTLTNAPTVSGGSTTAEVGGINIYASENYRYETAKTIIGSLELGNTKIASTLRDTTGTSPSGTETSFSTRTLGNAISIPFNENFNKSTTSIIASDINETNELAGIKSLFIPLTLTSQNSDITPIIDLGRASFIGVANRINNIDSSSDVFPTTNYKDSTQPSGDQNAFIYITKKVALENPATAIKLIFSAHKQQSAEIKSMFKILRTDDASDFDELGYTFFNSTGTTDIAIGSSLDDNDFQEYVYTAGVTDDGIGTPLPEFIQFAIKIVGQGTNAAQPPRIRDLRLLALAT